MSSPTDPFEVLEIGRGVFALALFALSIYAWSKRRQPALIIVAIAFFLFFAKTLLDYVLPPATEDAVRVGIDFASLALFFIAILWLDQDKISTKEQVETLRAFVVGLG